MAMTDLSGWWRLWIVGTVIYGAVVGIYTWQSIPSIENIPFDASHLKKLSDRSLEILAGRTQPPLPAGGPKWAESPINLEMCNGQVFQVLGNTPAEQSQEIAKDYVSVLKSIANERTHTALKTGLLIWLVPSISVIALGWAISWVYRGFKGRNA